MPVIPRQYPAIFEVYPSHGIHARNDYKLTVGRTEAGGSAIGSQKKTVAGRDLHRAPLKYLESLSLLAGDLTFSSHSGPRHDVVLLSADNLQDFILPNPFYRSVEFEDLTRFEIPGIAFLRGGPAQRHVLREPVAIAEISRPLPGLTDRARNSVDFRVRGAHDKCRAGLAAPVSEFACFHVRRRDHLGAIGSGDLPNGANLL
jgi:hypothetical protein